ncbi:MAG: FHA domain-containing protein [Candidatus Saccharimonadales bacterium]|jgi:hypothetical protein
MSEQIQTDQTANSELSSRTESFMADIGSQYKFETHKLVPGFVFELPNKVHGSMEIAHNGYEGVHQSLRAIIRADLELFGVVDVSVNSIDDSGKETNIDKVAITYLDPKGERASLVGFVEDKEPVYVGRGYQTGLDDGTSRRHFVVAKAEDGSVGIIDLGSTNGTEVITYPRLISERKFALQSLISQMPESARTASEPLKNIRLWSVKSAQIKAAIK